MAVMNRQTRTALIPAAQWGFGFIVETLFNRSESNQYENGEIRVLLFAPICALYNIEKNSLLELLRAEDR